MHFFSPDAWKVFQAQKKPCEQAQHQHIVHLVSVTPLHVYIGNTDVKPFDPLIFLLISQFVADGFTQLYAGTCTPTLQIFPSISLIVYGAVMLVLILNLPVQ